MVAKALSDCAKGQVLVIDGQGELNTALWGELTTLAALRKGLAGVVIDGAVRDIAAIRRSTLPVFARAVVPNAGGAEYLGELNVTVQCGGQIVRPGDWVIGDEDGVVVVPAEHAFRACRRARNRSSKRKRYSSSEIRKGADLGAVAADTRSHSSVNNRKSSFRNCEASTRRQSLVVSRLPAWGRAELPDPLPLSFRNALRTIGPGAILLAASIGGGEWLVGPAVAVKHGIGLFWIATLAIVLQTIFNLEAIRYTLYTGEPIVAGFMRLRPSSRFWATIYSILSVAQLGMPALGAASATVIFAAFAGRLPGAPDTAALTWITYLVMAVTVLILMSGGTVERTLERASWAMIVMIFAFLFIANLLFVPAEHWLETFQGFFHFGYWPPGIDIVLLTTLAATAGSGGIGNIAISNWVRDKGFGMGAAVGAIPGALRRPKD